MNFIGPDFRAGLRRVLYPLEPVAPLWSSLALFAVLAIASQLLQFVMALAIHLLAGQDLNDQTALVRSGMLSILPAGVLTIGLAWLFARWRRNEPIAMLRLHTSVLGGFGWAIVIVVFIFVMQLAAGLLIAAFNISPENVGVVENAMKALARDPAYPLIAVGIILAAPLAEELTFRGQVFAALARTRLGFSGTTVLTSAAWAGLHIGEPVHAVALLFIMGLVLGFLLVRFGSLWVCFVCHAVWNGMFTLAVLLAGSS
jgi:membrane protease YdiL (CAAX protease family)